MLLMAKARITTRMIIQTVPIVTKIYIYMCVYL